MRTEEFGIDVSSHNEQVDVAKLKSFVPKIAFGWARTGESYAWQDPKFNYFRDIFENQLGIWFGGYHILYPGENPAAQAKNMIKIAGKSLPGYACDTELIHGCSAKQIQTAMGIFAQEILMAGLPAWGYTSPGWANGWLFPASLPIPSWANLLKWWLGQYLVFPDGYIGYDEHPGPLMAMNGVKKEKVFIHQTTSSLPGKAIGQPAGSPRLDGNRMLIDFISGYMPPVIVPPIEIPEVVETMLFEARCLVTRLTIRTSPEKLSTNDTGKRCTYNTRYPVYEVKGDWWRIGVNQWACSREGADTYLEKVISKTELTCEQKLDLLRYEHPELFT